METTFFVRTLLLAGLLLILSAPVFSVVPEGSMKVYAVTTEGQGLVATLNLKIEPGTGKIWSSVSPLVGTTTQNAEKTAVKVARNYLKKWDNYDYKFSIDSSASVVDGPSAGAAMTLLTVSMLTDSPVPDGVSLTGTISEDGRIGQVGGVYEKAKEASSTGTKLFLVPKGEAIQTVRLPDGVKSVNILDYAPKTWGIKVVEVQTIDEAIKLAHSKLEDINISSDSGKAIPEFVPEKLRLREEIGPFKVLTTNYLNKTKQGIAEARNALSSSLLEDGELTHELVEILNNSEQTLERADVLNEQNYLYSAANFAFLARVNAIVVKEVSTNPKLLDPGSASLDLKLVELRKDFSTFENEMDGPIPKQGLEWFISAQQRFTYAKITVDSLSNDQTVVIVGNDSDQTATALKKLQDYAFAVAWLDVAKDFYNLAQDSDNFVERTGEFHDEADVSILDAEKILSNLEKDSPSIPDIKRRLDSARRERDTNWLEAAVFDAASAKALSRAEIETNEKRHDELKKMLQDKIVQVSSKLKGLEDKAKWAELYIDHAKYFLASAEYYDKSNLTTTSSESLKSGYGLALLAEEELAASTKVFDSYSKIAPIESKKATTDHALGTKNTSAQILNSTLFAIIAIMSVLVLLLGLGVAALVLSPKKQVSIAKEMARCRQLLRDVDAQFIKGAIDKETHNSLKRKYEDELAFLESERKKRARHIIAMEEYSEGIDSCKAKMKELNRHLKEGTISYKEFQEKSAEYLRQMDALKSRLESEMEKNLGRNDSIETEKIDVAIVARKKGRVEKKRKKKK